jgi:hypothetical protein
MNPRYFDYQPLGWANENYAHNPYDAPTTPVPSPHFDWGAGAALAAFAEVRNRFGDVWVDCSHGAAYGIDDVTVGAFSCNASLLSLELESRSPGHQVTLKVEGLRAQQIELRVNGISFGTVSRDDLSQGLAVPTLHRGRVIHNPWRVSPPADAADFVVAAQVTQGTEVEAATLHYRAEHTGWKESRMAQISGDRWAATIPGPAVVAGSMIEYYFSIQTRAGILRAPEVDPAAVPFRLKIT